MQKFNSINVESRFIKNFLRNTYLPILPTISDGDYIVKDVEYIYKNNVVKCNKSGILATYGTRFDNLTLVPRRSANGVIMPGEFSVACSLFATCGENFLCGGGIDSAAIDVVQSFGENVFVPGVTSAYTSNSEIYDVHTHRQLGKYLRWYRDTYDIDLMSLYNCFDGESTTLAHIKNNKVKSGVATGYISWIVPAQLNKYYTIFMDSSAKVSIRGVFLSNFGRIKYDGNNYLDEMLDPDNVEFQSATYSNPILYNTFTTRPELFANVNNFYLLIQTDKSYKGSFVVLEGDYTHCSKRVITSVERVAGSYKNAIPPPIPSISMLPTSSIIPYSDRLIEFLTHSVITKDEDIPNNVARVQQSMGIYGKEGTNKDVWDDKLRLDLYHRHFKYKNDYCFLTSNPSEEEIKERGPAILPTAEGGTFGVYHNNKLVGLKNCNTYPSSNNKYDITGYVDKDIENTLFKYRSNR